MSEAMKTLRELLQKAMKLGCKYQFQYYDYNPNEWTAPVLLTKDRIERLLSDKSISEIHIIIKP